MGIEVLISSDFFQRSSGASLDRRTPEFSVGGKQAKNQLIDLVVDSAVPSWTLDFTETHLPD